MSSVAASRLVDHGSPAPRCRDLLLGPPLATSRLVHERLRKLVALAVFSSDTISSTAYGTVQIMLILVAAGAVATGLAFPAASLEVVHCPNRDLVGLRHRRRGPACPARH
jgi:hypothetical protein